MGAHFNLVAIWWLLFLVDIPKIIEKTVHITKAFLKLEHYCC